MQTLGLVSFSNFGGGASRALRRWEILLSSSLKLQSKSFLFYQLELNQSSKLSDLVDHKVSANSTLVQAKIGRGLGLTDGGNLALNITPTFYGRRIRKIDVDFFNIHWFHGEMISIKQLTKISKPIVWTLHDPWLINGIGNYKQELRNGLLGRVHKGLDHWMQYRKKILLGRADKFIAPSNWIAQEFINFGISPERISVIPNPIDLKIFTPKDKELSRKKFNIESNKLVVLFGAGSDLGDKRKGFDLGIELLTRVSKNLKIELITFGNLSTEILVPFKRTHVGYIDSDEVLAELYSAADITLLPSRIDNLPQVMTESISCGTPVFTFPQGGPKTVINENLGCVASSFDLDMAEINFLEMYSNIEKFKPSNLANMAMTLWNDRRILTSFELFVEN